MAMKMHVKGRNVPPIEVVKKNGVGGRSVLFMLRLPRKKKEKNEAR